jgi:hypothetical protein
MDAENRLHRLNTCSAARGTFPNETPRRFPASAPNEGGAVEVAELVNNDDTFDHWLTQHFSS